MFFISSVYSLKILCELKIWNVMSEVNLQELCMILCQNQRVNAIIYMFLGLHRTWVLITLNNQEMMLGRT